MDKEQKKSITNNKIKIPKKLHIVWAGNRPCPKEWIMSWRNNHPKWDFYLWNEQNIVGFELQGLIDWCFEHQVYTGLADIVRYEALYKYGGVAVDADSECVKPIDDLLNIKEDFFACYQSEKHRPGLLSLQMGSTKGNKLMRAMIDVLKQRTQIRSAWLDTGNFLLTCMVNDTKHPIKIYPSNYFIPVYADGEENKGDGNIYAIQKWYSTNKLWNK
jgi:inositol phosphorylceramide mannosyltransferase catalytic subunit